MFVIAIKSPTRQDRVERKQGPQVSSPVNSPETVTRPSFEEGVRTFNSLAVTSRHKRMLPA